MSISNNSRPPFGGLLNIPVNPQVLKKFKLENSQMIEQVKKENKQGKGIVIKQLPNQQIGSFVINQMLQRMQQCQIAKQKQRQEFMKKSAIAQKLIKDYYGKSSKLQKQLEILKISTNQQTITLQKRMEPMQKNNASLSSNLSLEDLKQLRDIIVNQHKSWQLQYQGLITINEIIGQLKLQIPDSNGKQPSIFDDKIVQNFAKHDQSKQMQCDLNTFKSFLDISSKTRRSVYAKLIPKIKIMKEKTEILNLIIEKEKNYKKQGSQLRKSLQQKDKETKHITKSLEQVKQKLNQKQFQSKAILKRLGQAQQQLKQKDKQIQAIVAQLESAEQKTLYLSQTKKTQFQKYQQQILGEKKNLQSIIKLFEQKSLVNVNQQKIQKKVNKIKADLQGSHFQQQLEIIIKIMTEQYIGRRKQAKQHGQSVQKLIKQTKRHFLSTLDTLFQREKALNEKIGLQRQQLSELCKVCLDKPLEMINSTCNHIISCYTCSLQLNNECIICKTKGQYKRIYKM